jgi:hypothetical protein
LKIPAGNKHWGGQPKGAMGATEKARREAGLSTAA